MDGEPELSRKCMTVWAVESELINSGRNMFPASFFHVFLTAELGSQSPDSHRFAASQCSKLAKPDVLPSDAEVRPPSGNRALLATSNSLPQYGLRMVKALRNGQLVSSIAHAVMFCEHTECRN